MFDAYIACFSETRDSRLHWKTYGGGGDGVCLGVAIIREDPPLPEGRPSILVQVEYSEDEWRRVIRVTFEKIAGAFVRFMQTTKDGPTQDHAYQRTLNALSRVASFAGIGGKHLQYEREAEWRHTTPISREEGIAPLTRKSRGRNIEYIEVAARAEREPIVLSEFMLGPQTGPESEERARQLLTSLGYGSDSLPMPPIIRAAGRDE